MDANAQNDRPLSEKLHGGDIVRFTLSDGMTIGAVVECLYIGDRASQMILLKQIDHLYDHDNDYGRDPAPQDLMNEGAKWASNVGFSLEDAQINWFGREDSIYPGSLHHFFLDQLSNYMWLKIKAGEDTEWPPELKDYQNRLEEWARHNTLML
jgi:hypothetical protein